MALEKLSYTYDTLAEATGISKDEIRKAVNDSYLIRHYLKSKPIILATDAQAWLESLPTERT
jgi:hypothetical protein